MRFNTLDTNQYLVCKRGEDDASGYILEWGGYRADAVIDEVRISARVVPPKELAVHGTLGPGALVWGDGFESYSAGDEWTRGGGDRNHWRGYVYGEQSDFALWTDHVKSGAKAMWQEQTDAEAGNQTSVYYNMPVAATRDEPLVGTSGWVAFSGQDAPRLFFLNQVWTGVETHYGVTPTDLAGGIQYWGSDQTWRVERADGTLAAFSHPIAYPDDLDTWHYWRLIVDHATHTYVSFQFDEDIWDLSAFDAYVLPGFFDSSVLPVVDHNVRILEPDPFSAPYTTVMLLDEPAIEVWGY